MACLIDPIQKKKEAKRKTLATAWTAKILTLCPDMFPGPLGASVTGRALAEGVWTCDAVDIRDYAHDKHKSVDDTPAGGGAGMVMRADVLAEAIDDHWDPAADVPLICLGPRGEPLTQSLVREFADGPGLVALCGRFEGIDQRLFEARPIREVSVGDYVLSGGEIAAMVLLDASVRLLAGVLGAEESLTEESFDNGLLEYPQYTKPALWQGRAIPEVLMSGHHGKIAAWRKQQAEDATRARRPDLWQRYENLNNDLKKENEP